MDLSKYLSNTGLMIDNIRRSSKRNLVETGPEPDLIFHDDKLRLMLLTSLPSHCLFLF